MDHSIITVASCAHAARSLTDIYSAPLLPNEPRLLQPEAQAELTARYLLPALAELEACLLAVRIQLDSELECLQPVKLGKPYPLGQCLEIALAVQQRLRTVTESQLTPEAGAGLRALRTFLRAGGAFRQVWGDLRGQYFQNAFQLGTLYIDVANDTVTLTKPKVEILPFEAAQFIPVRDFAHFRQIARSYWQHEVYPNHVLPTLAPHCPLIHVSQTGRFQLHDATHYMLGLTHRHGFTPSEAVLRETPLPAALFERIRSALQDAGWPLASTPEQGRRQALQHCRLQRTKRWHQASPPRVMQIIREVQQLNLHLAHWHHANPPLPQAPLHTLWIDDGEYPLDNLPVEAMAPLQGIQCVDQELSRLQARIAILQTARSAYVNALEAALSTQ